MTARTAPRSRDETGVKLHIDWTACDGRGLCMELLPELLQADDWGYPVLLQRGAPVPPAVLEAARDAVAACPKRALKLLPR
jgi:ferredoxin